MDGRFTVSTDDIRNVALPVLRHRIGCNFAASSEGVDSVEIVRRLLAAVPEPEIAKYAGKKDEKGLPAVDPQVARQAVPVDDVPEVRAVKPPIPLATAKAIPTAPTPPPPLPPAPPTK